jgi:predicted HTH domain antitoxin
MKTVTTRIPEEDAEALAELEAEMSADRAEVLRRLIRQGLEDWRRETTLEGLREHELTVRKAAELADVSYVEMVTMASEAGIDVGYSTEDLQQDLDRI